MSKDEKQESQDSWLESPEGWVSQNIRALRDERNWNQSELARRMQQEGFENYNQMLVSRTEKGERPLRLNEAEGFARVFGVSLPDLLDPGPWVGLASAVDRFASAKRKLNMVIHDYLEIQRVLGTYVSALTARPDPAVSDEAAEVAFEVLNETPYDVVADAWDEYRHTNFDTGNAYLGKQRRGLRRRFETESAMKDFETNPGDVFGFNRYWIDKLDALSARDLERPAPSESEEPEGKPQ